MGLFVFLKIMPASLITVFVSRRRTLSLAIELGERAVEAQACYSLGNTYTLLRDFPTAIDYHQRHLAIAQELGDRIGEARACWSLGNAHTSIGNHEKALHYANSHYLLAKELGDMVGESTARMNMADLRKILGLPELEANVEAAQPSELGGAHTAPHAATAKAPTDGVGDSESGSLHHHTHHGQQVHVAAAAKVASLAASKQHRLRRQSMEQLDLIKVCTRLPAVLLSCVNIRGRGGRGVFIVCVYVRDCYR